MTNPTKICAELPGCGAQQWKKERQQVQNNTKYETRNTKYQTPHTNNDHNPTPNTTYRHQHQPTGQQRLLNQDQTFKIPKMGFVRVVQRTKHRVKTTCFFQQHCVRRVFYFVAQSHQSSIAKQHQC